MSQPIKIVDACTENDDCPVRIYVYASTTISEFINSVRTKWKICGDGWFIKYSNGNSSYRVVDQRDLDSLPQSAKVTVCGIPSTPPSPKTTPHDVEKKKKYTTADQEMKKKTQTGSMFFYLKFLSTLTTLLTSTCTRAPCYDVASIPCQQMPFGGLN